MARSKPPRSSATASADVKRVTLCADDFGLSRGIEDGILDLVEQRRLNAVSCMVNVPHDAAAWRRLAASPDLEIGLHVSLTLVPPVLPAGRVPSLVGPDGRFRPFPAFLAASLLGRLSADDVDRELDAQYARFVERIGRPPDFLDGHHHVQQLPVVRGAVLRRVRSLPARQRPYVRNCHASVGRVWRQGVDRLKALAVTTPGGPWRRALLREGIRTNRGFGGLYDWRRTTRFPGHMDRFLAFADDGGLIMVHPGFDDPDTARYDPFAIGRADERAHLAGGAFAEQLERHGVVLGCLATPVMR